MLSPQIEALEKELSLPDLVPFETTPDTECVYGIDEIVRQYCGLEYMPRLIPGFWCHGWQPDYYHIHPEMLCRRGKPERLQWFPRQSQAEYLRREGYVNTKAIGHPIIYLPPVDLPRRAESLLVMPTRSFAGSPVSQDCAYPEAVAELRGQFEEIVVCISPQSFDQGDWLDEFRKMNLPIVRGSWGRDRNGFLRIARLMTQFGYVTTNGMGSQIAYAAYFGARTSVWGPLPVVAPPDKPARLFNQVPAMREEFHRTMSIERLLQEEPWLGVAPREAPLAVEWGRRELGEENKLSPEDLAEEFHLTPKHLRNWSRELEAILIEQKRLKRLNAEQALRIQELERRADDEGRARAKHQKEAEKKLSKTVGDSEKFREMRESLAWKLIGRPLHSLEKRLRRPASP